jgi:hypothetical protein
VLEVRTLPASVLSIDADVDVLWIVHPAMLDDSTLSTRSTSSSCAVGAR